jgi:two-component system sensor histidine kinase KdpD
MKMRLLSAQFLNAERPSQTRGLVVALASVAAATAVIYPLKHLAPVVSLGVVYLLGVLIVSTFWGLAFGLFTAVLSAAAFNFFHLAPVGRFVLSDSRNWVALCAFTVVAVATGLVSELARARAREADQRRREADLAAQLAQQLLGAAHLADALPVAGRLLAATLSLPSAAIEMREVDGSARRLAFPLVSEGDRIGTLLLPASLSAADRERVRERIVPPLASILAAVRHRADLQDEVVETAALRRADSVKTALLRAVSHDLRSPLTAISAASEALGSPSLSAPERVEMAMVIEQEARRLSRLVDNLLDLSRLQAGAAEPRRHWTSVEELLRAALSELGARPEEFNLSLNGAGPLINVDPVQMERALVNVLENARRHSGEHPVSVRARAVRSFASTGHPTPRGGELRVRNATRAPRGDRMIVRVVDRGPGISPADLERVFEPFYRARRPAGDDRGSGLGLSIARGFTEANSGSLYAESLPRQGATFVFELPIAPQEAERPGPPTERGQDPRPDAGAPRREPAAVTPSGAEPVPPRSRVHAGVNVTALATPAPAKASAAQAAAKASGTPAAAKASAALAAAKASTAPPGGGDRPA